jgi:hypothetical protein
METTGQMDVGPSEDYLALLRGDIDSEEYVRRLKADVNARRNADRTRRERRCLERSLREPRSTTDERTEEP